MEEMNLSKNILESVKADIDKSLPREVGDSLKKRLERCDELEIETKDQKTEIKNLDKVVEIKDTIISELEKEKKALEEKLKDIEHRERDMKITILESKLVYSQQSKDDIYRLADKVFGVPTVTVTNDKREHYTNQQTTKWNPSTRYHDYVNEDVKTGETEITTTKTIKE